MRIIFMGTPEFSIPTLQALFSEHEVVAVFTQAPKPSGRGYNLIPSPVHKASTELNIPVYTPKTLRKPETQSEFLKFDADAAVVIAYGLILPREILQHPKYGCINIHPSSLPKFRGAAPMQHTILSGDDSTQMCIMQMDEGIDTGDVLLRQDVPLTESTTYIQLSNLMANLGAEMLLSVLKNIDHIIPEKQNYANPSYAPKLQKEDGEIHWNESAKILSRKIRALNPWPGTYFSSNNEKIKILEANYIELEHNHIPGTILGKNPLHIACKTGVLIPITLQRPGKKPMNVDDFMRGYELLLS